ncbi:alanyl-tRNA synthetase [Dysgonomonas sp. PFB1-18]|uniref:alanine--tRNA ligase n=1 Tax=unclassified Dysgonomonas TaxID=2630389 RepID=UPI002476C290|nr:MULTISPECIES: alanine--tRNA ligase [unclassified Dysgonomonas]MDH6309694.1 alanyl-tRNA synthetase [Dysgonomonas sp. PF1-14]MDH6339298.1 alanyl-tRNA synthetase [Dysgonomonas sp. PF1-16]MDH6380797.1 alanyl-tRNA synthetase [Dysgonomonas sp. PFB1-18]MDH6398293.1 alanyl-tRNA synthetase [Dysgonomonas sp. PF1-23]
MMTSKEIRDSFKSFFTTKGHQIVPSAPMVIKDDPTLMFTNAGMNQFKDIILGNAPIKYPRVADSQKCLRVSGKHNDLEEVGHDTYHHTMFEMLGNWSFGDYFKKEAIEWAWEYLTEVLKLDKERLYVTVFEGSPEEGLDRDDEAAGYWEKYLPKGRIINGNKKDNFWEMGDTGPCGPCSEIHIDLRPDEERVKVDGLTLVNESHPQVIEIWNLVFMQFNRKADKSLEPLPAKVIDTGMGFERLCMAVQGKISNYDTDVFQIIIKAIGEISGSIYGQDEKKDIAMRVIADHIRTIAFSITDGQLPSNAKAGYVIRRILRRAVRYGYTFLDQHKAFMYKLIPALIETMGDAYPELVQQRVLIEKVMKEEEESFLRTLETGIKLLDKQITDTKAKGSSELNGTDAFTLYDTYGFPLDLTELILRENGMTVDNDGFKSEMQKQKDRARNAAAVETGDWVTLKEGEQEFFGYDVTECETEILRYRKVKQKNHEFYQLVLNRTPFYAEMGGQVGDSGWLINDDEEIEITDTKRENNLAVHLANKLPQDVTAIFVARINTKNRTATECNHTATHLLHEGLREILGNHVEQKGSYVSPSVLRFDFSHFQKLTDKEIRKIERYVTAKIRENITRVEMRHVPIAEAKEMGAMALFGEKYGDDVRVIRFGDSVELCGGTHISSTGRIGSFRIINESSIAAGIRRIEAITAEVCEDYFYTQQEVLTEVKSFFNNTPNLIQSLHKFIEENSELKKQVEEYVKEKTVQIKEALIKKKQVINGIDVFVLTGPFPADIAKDIAFQLKGQFPANSVFVGATQSEDKPMLTLMISDDLVKDRGLNASQIVRDAAKHIQGGGGGQPHFATAGGKNADGLSNALHEITEKLK